MMTGPTKELYDRDKKEKEKNEQHNKGVSVRVERPNVPCRRHLFLQDSTRSDGLELSTCVVGGVSREFAKRWTEGRSDPLNGSLKIHFSGLRVSHPSGSLPSIQLKYG